MCAQTVHNLYTEIVISANGPRMAQALTGDRGVGLFCGVRARGAVRGNHAPYGMSCRSFSKFA